MPEAFLTDIKSIRERARQAIESGSYLNEFHRKTDTVIDLLNHALATELVCVLRYKRHYYTADGINAPQAQAEFLQNAIEEQQHADQLAARVVQLGGKPDFSPASGLAERSHAESAAGDDIESMLKEDLIAGRIAIDSYKEMIAFVSEDDRTTQRTLESILAMEEEHAEDLASLLGNVKGLDFAS
ncbi:MAG: ferritin-like domain-containing protein [Chloroflexi bacterium]|nr:ferritin-like domain-containing protein [Chloroflexota bacterium]MDA1174301.1 ferritin-like domain-containing protein [Chloroflexota bacterium]